MQQGRSHDPVQVHRESCRSTQDCAEQKLGRPLTREESDKIWNCGSFMMLEQIDMAIHYAKSPADVEKYLAEFPFLGPLPPEYTIRD